MVALHGFSLFAGKLPLFGVGSDSLRGKVFVGTRWFAKAVIYIVVSLLWLASSVCNLAAMID